MPPRIVEKLVSDEVVLQFMRERTRHRLSLEEDTFPVFQPYREAQDLAHVYIEGGRDTDMKDDPDGFGVYLIYSLRDTHGIFLVTASQSMISIRRAKDPHDGWVVRCAPNWNGGTTAWFWRNAPGRPLPEGYFRPAKELADTTGTNRTSNGPVHLQTQ